MKENYLEEQKKVTILNVIVDVIASKNNIVEIFREVRNYLKTIIPFDYVTVLFNNEKARYFYVVPALNISQQALQGEIIIPYNETSITEILQARTSINRADLKIRGNLTPGDLKFLAHGISSDLSTPIIYQNRVRAVLNLSSYKSRAFTEYHQAIVEEVAVLLSIALERIDLIDEIRELKYDASHWREKYKKLFKNTIDAIALVSSDVELIYETNKAFEALTGYTSEQLHGMRYTKLHPKMQNHVFSKITKDTANGKVSELDNSILFRSDGQQIPVKLRFVAPFKEDEPLLFAFYQDLSQRKQHQEANYQSFSQLSSLLQIGNKLLATTNLKLIATSLLDEIGIGYYAQYALLHLVDEISSKLKMFCARTLPFENETQIAQPLIIGLSEGPYQEVITKNDVIKFENIFDDPRYFKWLPVAQKLGYRSLICLPLKARNKTIGVLSLFFKNLQLFDNKYIFNLKNAVNFVALVIDSYKFNQKLKDAQQQISVINKITKLINSGLELKEIIRTATLETKKIIDFDHFLVTLFNDSTEHYQKFTITSEMYGKLFNPESWESFGEADLGWIEISEQQSNGNGKKNVVDNGANKLQSKLSTLLLARNKYLGTITLASLEPIKYSKENQAFLEQIAAQLAIAIENAMLFEEANKRFKEFSTLAELSKSLNTSLNLDQILSQVMRAVSKATNTNLCTIRFVDGSKTSLEVISTIPEAEQKGLLIKEVQEFIPQILKNPSPLYIDNFKSFRSDSPFNTGYPQGYNAYLGIPIISKNQVIAVISVYWERAHTIEECEINLISTIANQAASVIENIRLYQETLKNSNELKKSNQELENFVYTVSHDLKSPIVSIQGFTSIMLNDFQTFLNEESFHYLKRIQSNANRMEVLVKDLLELSRIGRVVSPFEEVEVDEIISQTTGELIYQIEEKKIKLVIDSKLPVIYCDKKRINQVFSNLIDNAIKYIGENNPAPQIEIGYKDENEKYLFYVKDNGIGIPNEYHQQIFGLFRGVDLSESDDYRTGVGLTIVKRIVENHCGKIWVNSEPENGSTFFFTIPKKSD